MTRLNNQNVFKYIKSSHNYYFLEINIKLIYFRADIRKELNNQSIQENRVLFWAPVFK